MNRHALLVILGTVAILALLALFAHAGKLGGESCQCFFTGQCRYENHGFGEFVGYNLHVCRGSCAAYNWGWVEDRRCMYPEKTV